MLPKSSKNILKIFPKPLDNILLSCYYIRVREKNNRRQKMKLSTLALDNIKTTANILGMIKNGVLQFPSGTVIKLAFMLSASMLSSRCKIEEDLLPEIYRCVETYSYKVVSPPESTVKDDEIIISISIEIP
jgi:hypothetical protein